MTTPKRAIRRLPGPGRPLPGSCAHRPLDDDLLPREAPPAGRATARCADCHGALGEGWDVDRSVLRCGGLAGDPCGAPVHDACLDAKTLELAACPACLAAQGRWCRAHFLAATVVCPECAGGRHVAGACGRVDEDDVWRCGAHAAGPALAAGRNQGAFVRRAAGITDPGLHGFTFSTRSELAVAQALERRRLWWSALIPVRVTDDDGRRRTRETDFLVITGGAPGILEVDGGPHRGRAAEDHAKDRASKRAGIWVVERVSSVEAVRDADRVVGRFVAMLRAYARRAA